MVRTRDRLRTYGLSESCTLSAPGPGPGDDVRGLLMSDMWSLDKDLPSFIA
jgi:hypothetical protein